MKRARSEPLLTAFRRLQMRFTRIARSARHDRIRSQGSKPKLIRTRDRVSLRIRRELNHRLPHFHIEFKTLYAASYAITTGERLAGRLPPKYENEMLAWARRNAELLLREWRALNGGASIQLALDGGRK